MSCHIRHTMRNHISKGDQKCYTGCFKRTKPPPIPTSLPYPATEANREKLQQYLLDYYSSSTFNVCEHQTLPLMEGPPMRLMIDPQASPTAHHSPIPVPLHWQDDVKDGLDRDVRLGVLEPVPIGEPHGATELLSVPRKMAHLEGPSISSHSTSMPPGKRTTPNHPSTRRGQSLKGRRKPCLMHGMATTAFLFILKTDTLPPSSPHGAATDIARPHKATLPQVMDTLDDMMRSPRPYPTKQNV